MLPVVCAVPSTRPRLASAPFFVSDARRSGLTWDNLQSSDWTRLSRGQYVSARLCNDIRLHLEAVVSRLPSRYAFSGRTAAWLHGLDMAPCNPVEVTVGRETPIRARAGIRLRRAALPDCEVVTIGGFRATSAMRTVCDLGSGADLSESVVAIDMAVRVRLVELSELVNHVTTHAGAKGNKRLRRACAFADPRSESPMETRVRIELVKARLPQPGVQVDLRDGNGNFLGRADLYFPDRRLVIEFDGEHHRDRLVADLRRQNALLNAGYHVLRFTAADLRSPGSIAAHVRLARARLKKPHG